MGRGVESGGLCRKSRAGRGVAVHVRGCPQTLSLDPRRLLPVSWDDSVKTQRAIRLRVHCMDELGILAHLTQAISAVGANIVSAQVGATPDGKAICRFEVKVDSVAQLDNVTRNLEKIDGVIRVERTKRLERD